ncbi:MAG: competence/damage-inducible protein A [Anaerolineae bacterium]|nr:competence/damage-inducible protein A [Anaerolineae bacterium]
MLRASLLAIGNELLNGAIQDTHVFFLSRQLTHLGFCVEYAAMVRDQPSSIATLLHTLLESEPDILICSGGLGPTDDDLTLTALAQALDLPLEFNAAAFAQMQTHYERLWAQHYLAEKDPPEVARKMAVLPQGARPLANPLGTAPGVQLRYGPTHIYVLPGVPAELEAIFSDVIAPELQAHFEVSVWIEGALLIHCDDEAQIAPVLHAVVQRHPAVYLKSLAEPFQTEKEGLRVIAGVHAKETQTAQSAVEQTLTDLHRTAEAAGLRVTRILAND